MSDNSRSYRREIVKPKTGIISAQSSLMRQDRSALILSITRSRKRALRVLSKLEAVPKPILALGIAAAAMVILFMTNLVYQMA